ncbi:MAG TPA: hypothetical protein VF170_06880 [Planctomycetaceae bacterium]
MNNLTSFQRKLAYLAGIVILLVPIIWLGMPAGRDETGRQTAGGRLAKLRESYELGETSLGNVDPSSSTMNLVLLGFRGVATNLLWQNAMEQRDRKQWAQLRGTVDSIIMLQPHYVKVWDFQGWNLAYNVSAEWDNVPDRYYWVKEGGKFYMRGTDRNARNPDLVFKTGTVLSHKIGRSDEWEYYRDYFLDDPDDESFPEGPDPGFNRGYDQGPFDDNYLAARDWFLEANEREETHGPQRIMMRELFRSYPAHSYMEMGNILHREGEFGEKSRQAWADGFEAWTQEYGGEEFPTRIGPVRLEVTKEEDFEEIARRNSELLGRTVTVREVKDQIDFLQNTVNYRYWRTRSLAESQPGTAQAHLEIYEGRQLFKASKLRQAEERIRSGLVQLEELFKNYPGFEQDDLAVEEVLMAQLYLRAIYNLYKEPVPDDLPLRRIWTANENGVRLPELMSQFRRETGFSPSGDGQP